MDLDLNKSGSNTTCDSFDDYVEVRGSDLSTATFSSSSSISGKLCLTTSIKTFTTRKKYIFIYFGRQLGSLTTGRRGFTMSYISYDVALPTTLAPTTLPPTTLPPTTLPPTTLPPTTLPPTTLPPTTLPPTTLPPTTLPPTTLPPTTLPPTTLPPTTLPPTTLPPTTLPPTTLPPTTSPSSAVASTTATTDTFTIATFDGSTITTFDASTRTTSDASTTTVDGPPDAAGAGKSKGDGSINLAAVVIPVVLGILLIVAVVAIYCYKSRRGPLLVSRILGRENSAFEETPPTKTPDVVRKARARSQSPSDSAMKPIGSNPGGVCGNSGLSKMNISEDNAATKKIGAPRIADKVEDGDKAEGTTRKANIEMTRLEATRKDFDHNDKSDGQQEPHLDFSSQVQVCEIISNQLYEETEPIA
eukprot:gene10765-11915_t